MPNAMIQFSPKTTSKASLWWCVCSYQGEAGGAAGGGRRQRHLRKPRQTDQVRRQADKGRPAGRRSPHGGSGVDLNVPSFHCRCSRVPPRTSKPSTRPPPPPCVGCLCRLTARSTSSQVGPLPALGPLPPPRPLAFLTSEPSRPAAGKLNADGTLHVTLCDFIELWESTSATQKKSLTQRYEMGCDCKVKRRTREECWIPRACY